MMGNNHHNSSSEISTQVSQQPNDVVYKTNKPIQSKKSKVNMKNGLSKAFMKHKLTK